MEIHGFEKAPILIFPGVFIVIISYYNYLLVRLYEKGVFTSMRIKGTNELIERDKDPEKFNLMIRRSKRLIMLSLSVGIFFIICGIIGGIIPLFLQQ